MLTGIHFLLTYKCIYECDHCFVYSSPQSEGTFTFQQIKDVLSEAEQIGTIEWIYFEGGEPFLYYPLMIEGIRASRSYGFKVGIVTNAYFATNFEDAKRWLLPLKELGVADLSISNDSFHSDDVENSSAKIALRAAQSLGLSAGSITIDEPEVRKGVSSRKKGEPVVGGGVMFRGRAVEKLSKGLPGINWKEFTECPYEELASPERVHVDAFGNVQLCQGICVGNMWKRPLSKLIKEYKIESNPICNSISQGGPAGLVGDFGIEHKETYIDACHLCFETRRQLMGKFPDYLSPMQVYGLKQSS